MMHGLGIRVGFKWFWFLKVCPRCFKTLGKCNQPRIDTEHACEGITHSGVKCVALAERIGVFEACNNCEIRFKCFTTILSRDRWGIPHNKLSK